ncbi:acyltransferase family protein [uncultured Methanobrevibacter sp.]|uniref:acyltransferase n=1 Tax=uncultured Methanobrevibacter sp. TaxID=253161 RepID=UPI00261946F6
MSNTVVGKKKSKRIFYFDALRALAITCVIVVHIYAITRSNVIGEFAIMPSLSWLVMQVMGNPFRIGVDVFLMLSGALSLGRVWDIKTFLGKRIPRIVSPFIFWNAVLITLFVLISYFTSIHFVKSFDIATIGNFYLNAILANHTLGFRANWFFWMILGTYLIMPIFNKWLLHSELTEAEYFLAFWLITSIFDFTLFTEFPVKLSYFTSPIGFVVLGYYLRHTKRKIFENKFVVWLLVLAPAIAMISLCILKSSPTKMFYFNRYSIFLAIEAAGVFLLFRNHKFNINKEGYAYKFIFSMAKYSYGMYLIHYPLIVLLYKILPPMNQVILVIVLFVLIVPLTMIIMDLLNRVPYVKGIIGAK